MTIPITPRRGALVRLSSSESSAVRGMVLDLRPKQAPVEVQVRWGSDSAWHLLSEMTSGYQPRDQVRHLGRRSESLGTGTVIATRRLAGFEQVLVQFAETGESRWVDWRLLTNAVSVETRIARRLTGEHADHAERARLRVLANALKIWNSNTGAFGRLDIDPLPHQLDVARKVVTAPQARWLIADDVGLGKTIEVGLILHALEQRNRCRRVLIICPSSLTRQWKEEMRNRFGRAFEIYSRDFRPEYLEEMRLRDNVIISLDLAKREEHTAMLIAAGNWDAIVFDEAHRLGRSESGEQTERYVLAKQLRDRSHAFLLLTATPHQGKTLRFAALLELVRPDLASKIATLSMNPEVVGEIIIRNRKSSVTDAEGVLIFRGHDTQRYMVQPSSGMWNADAALSSYLRDGYRASANARNRTMGRAIGFVMTTYRKLASSSLAAIERALERRLGRLESDLASVEFVTPPEEDLEGFDDLAEVGTVSSVGAFFEDEVTQVRSVLDKIRFAKKEDAKLIFFLESVVKPLIERGESLLVFTEYRATQTYLKEAIEHAFPALRGAEINGSMSLDAKTDAVLAFNSREAQVLISTEAGGEGLNLQEACHVMVNYDLPWNPSRLVQRIGRLYRYGQTRRVQVINLQADDGFDNSAISLMLERVTTIANDMAVVAGEMQEALAADILGELMSNIDMEEILERATSMKFEQTAEDIEVAIRKAQVARAAEVDILQYASSAQTRVSGGFESRHMVSFVESMAAYAGFEVRKVLHDGKTLEIVLPAADERQWPEFGRKAVVLLTVDHIRARRDSSLVPMDFESSFVRYLAALASDRLAFDGLYGEASGLIAPSLLTVHQLRWQDLSGLTLEEDLVPILTVDGRSTEMNRKDFASLLASPLMSLPRLATAQAVGDDAARVLARRVDDILLRKSQPEVMPGSVMTMAAISFLSAGDSANEP